MKHTLIYLSQNSLSDKWIDILQGVDVFIYRAFGKTPSLIKKEVEMLKEHKGSTSVFVADHWRAAKEFQLEGIYLETKKENPLLVRDLLSPDQKILVSVKGLKDLDFANTIEADGLVVKDLNFEIEEDLEESYEEIRMLKRFADSPLYLGGALTPSRLTQKWINVADGFVFEHYLEYDTKNRLTQIQEKLRRP